MLQTRVLAPLVAEFLLGDFPLTSLPRLLAFAPLVRLTLAILALIGVGWERVGPATTDAIQDWG